MRNEGNTPGSEQEFVGPDAHNPQGIDLPPEDVERARASVRAQDDAAEHPTPETEELRRRFDKAVRHVTGTAAPEGAAGDRAFAHAGEQWQEAEASLYDTDSSEPTPAHRPAQHAPAEQPPHRRSPIHREGPKDTILDELLGLDSDDDARYEEGSAPKGGYYNVERLRPRK